MATPTRDAARAEAFADRLVGVLNDAFLGLMISVGHQTGLFEAMNDLPPSTSRGIAEAAKLDERYVREWLGAMVTGRVVEHDPAAGTYRLPPEHAAFLTRAAGPDNLAMFTRYIALSALVETEIVECFRKGGGVPYAAYPRFQELQAEETALLYDAKLVDTFLPLVSGLPERLRRGLDVLDVGCGQGHAVNLMAKAFPESRFTGYDVSEAGISAARKEAAALGLPNARFEVRDTVDLDEGGRYDLVTAFDVVHDLARPRDVLRNIAHALRPEGTFFMMDIAASSELAGNLEHPLGPLLYTASTFYCMTTSLAQGGEGLGTAWGEQRAQAYLKEAGFTDVTLQKLDGDLMHVFYVARKAQ